MSMYRLPPIISPNMEFDLPTRMYKLPVIQQIEPQTIENGYPEEISNDELSALKDLEKRQESILNQLENLKLEVQQLRSPKSAQKSGPKDLVIRASPEHAPQILPIICNQLLSQLKVFITTHVHSSVIKGIPNLLKDFLPSSNCDSRTQANVCITLIWKNVGKDLELVTSPTSMTFIKSEVNLLRYFSRRFNLFTFQTKLNETKKEANEAQMDNIYSELWSSGNIVSMVESNLKSEKFLIGEQICLADVYAMSILKQTKKVSKPIQDWLKRCEIILAQEKQGLTRVPKTRPLRKPRSRQSSTLSKTSESQLHPGDSLEYQWPETLSVYLAKELMVELINENPIALVSEKLDGSNLSISSTGIIASRRKILLVNPKIEELSKTKFAGEPLISLEGHLKAVKNIEKQVFHNLLPNLKFNVIMYGEWIQEGTAGSKKDVFNYKQREIFKGNFYGFGFILTFPEETTEEIFKKVQNTLNNKGFSTAIQNSKKTVVITLNGELKHLFNKFKIPTVPILQTLPFVKVFEKVCSDLLEQKVEGFVITIPSKGIILKWKGCEDTDPRRVEALIEITEKLKDSENIEAMDPLNKVLQESLLYIAHGKKRYFDPTLVDAFNSARSKFPRLDDILNNVGDPIQKAKLIEGYKFTLVKEITKDFGKAFGVNQESIMSFVNQEVQP